MKALYFIACAEIIIYLALTIFTFKCIPKSISDTYYQWKSKGIDSLFTFIMWTVGMAILIYWISLAPNALKWMPFLSISGMFFVGGACAFKQELTDIVHYTSAGIWAFFAVLFFLIMKDYVALVSGLAVFFLIALIADKKHYTFWAEVACIVMMMIGIYNL